MRQGFKRLITAFAVLLLAAGLAACGGGNDSSSDSTSAGAATSHGDSGGGSAPYIVVGGDNTMQEYGKEASHAEFEVAAAALHKYLDARAEDNWPRACSLMSRASIKSFEDIAAQSSELKDKSCAALLERITESGATQETREEAEKADVRSLRVKGKQGFVIYTVGEDTVIGIGVWHEDGTWKVSNLTGTPLT